MKEFSRAEDKEQFDGYTYLLEVEDIEYLFISGLELFKFKTDVKIIDYISLIGNNMVLYDILIGQKYTFFIAHHYKFIENDKIEEGILLNSSNQFTYHLEKCGRFAFKRLERNQSHSFWPGVEGGEEKMKRTEMMF